MKLIRLILKIVQVKPKLKAQSVNVLIACLYYLKYGQSYDQADGFTPSSCDHKIVIISFESSRVWIIKDVFYGGGGSRIRDSDSCSLCLVLAIKNVFIAWTS